MSQSNPNTFSKQNTPDSLDSLIFMAFTNSREKKLTIDRIYEFITGFYSEYKKEKEKCLKIIGNCLIVNDCFVCEPSENEGVEYWELNPDYRGQSDHGTSLRCYERFKSSIQAKQKNKIPDFLIFMAFTNSREKKLTIYQIYEFITGFYPEYKKEKEKNLKSIVNFLIANDCFVFKPSEKEGVDHWELNPDYGGESVHGTSLGCHEQFKSSKQAKEKKKTTDSLDSLIFMAFNNAREKKLTIYQIYEFITGFYPKYKIKEGKCLKIIGNCLIFNDCFVCEPSENEGVEYWKLNPDFVGESDHDTSLGCHEQFKSSKQAKEKKETPDSLDSLIFMAFTNAREKKLTIYQIYEFITGFYPEKCLESIGNCLIFNDCFVCEPSENEGVDYWKLNPDYGGKSDHGTSIGCHERFQSSKQAKETPAAALADMEHNESSATNIQLNQHPMPCNALMQPTSFAADRSSRPPFNETLLRTSMPTTHQQPFTIDNVAGMNLRSYGFMGGSPAFQENQVFTPQSILPSQALAHNTPDMASWETHNSAMSGARLPLTVAEPHVPSFRTPLQPDLHQNCGTFPVSFPPNIPNDHLNPYMSALPWHTEHDPLGTAVSPRYAVSPPEPVPSNSAVSDLSFLEDFFEHSANENDHVEMQHNQH